MGSKLVGNSAAVISTRNPSSLAPAMTDNTSGRWAPRVLESTESKRKTHCFALLAAVRYRVTKLSWPKCCEMKNPKVSSGSPVVCPGSQVTRRRRVDRRWFWCSCLRLGVRSGDAGWVFMNSSTPTREAASTITGTSSVLRNFRHAIANCFSNTVFPLQVLPVTRKAGRTGFVPGSTISSGSTSNSGVYTHSCALFGAPVPLASNSTRCVNTSW
mmetsp:Transcript_5056/g.10472  ORF Transcript_5056/g.10472 Transcript_5056/m.10472 type:complete len:214 (+) Transcript_5056:1174-1815(+)